MAISLEELGLSQDEIIERIVEGVTDTIMRGQLGSDNMGFDYDDDSPLWKRLKAETKNKIDAAITKVADEQLAPRVDEYIKNFIVQQTNQYGEKKGEPVTLVEYMIGKAEEYMNEQVDHNGKAKSQSSGYSWTGRQTRLANMIHQHLQYSIENAMKEILGDGVEHVKKAIEQTAKIKLDELAKTLKVNVQMKN